METGTNSVTQKICICPWLVVCAHDNISGNIFHLWEGACSFHVFMIIHRWLCQFAHISLLWILIESLVIVKLCHNHKFTESLSPLLQVVARERCRWQHWRLLTWRWRAGHAIPASPAGGSFPAVLQMSEASSALGASSSRGRITFTPDLTLSAPRKSMIWIKVSCYLTLKEVMSLRWHF